jgi:hypothetical protein
MPEACQAHVLKPEAAQSIEGIHGS